MKHLILAALAITTLSACGAPPVFDIIPSCGGGFQVPQYRVNFLTFIGNVRAEVKDAQGQPVPDAKVNIRAKEIRKILCGPAPFYPVRADGTYEWERVKTGTYIVSYYKNGKEAWEYSGVHQEQEIEVKANETTVVTFTKPAE